MWFVAVNCCGVILGRTRGKSRTADIHSRGSTHSHTDNWFPAVSTDSLYDVQLPSWNITAAICATCDRLEADLYSLDQDLRSGQ